jgi:ferredoxin-NADP reductase
MTTFHSLTVAKVEPETRDAVTILCGAAGAAGGLPLSPGPAPDA